MFMNPLNKALLSEAPTVEVPKALNLGAQPDEDTLNCALLSTAPTVMVPRMQALGAQPNEDTLNCALLSTVPTVMVPRMQALGAQLDENNSNIDLRKKIIDKMTSHWEKVKSHAEIRKNARIISQASRTNTGPSFFKSLPDELQIKIASFTGNPMTHNEKESKKIAYENLGKPSL